MSDPDTDTRALLAQLLRQRGQADPLLTVLQQRQAQPQHLPMRNAEHALFAREVLRRLGPLGVITLLAAVPGYSAAKALGARPGATPPSLNEVKWGLAPLWGGVPPAPRGKVGPAPKKKRKKNGHGG